MSNKFELNNGKDLNNYNKNGDIKKLLMITYNK